MTTMSLARAKVLGESAKELTPEKNLDRANEHTKFIIATVGTIGTLLAGLGGVTAAITIDRTTLYLGGIPVVPVGALVTSALAGLSVGVALWGRRPKFAEVNPSILEDVDNWFTAEIDRKRRPVTWSARFFIWAAFAAVLTSVIAGTLVLADPVSTPRNLTSFSTTVADKGVVTMHLGGTVDGLDDHAHMSVVVTTNASGQTKGSKDRLVDIDVRPDADGKVTLDAEAIAPVGSSSAVATGARATETAPPRATRRGRSPSPIQRSRHSQTRTPLRQPDLHPPLQQSSHWWPITCPGTAVPFQPPSPTDSRASRSPHGFKASGNSGRTGNSRPSRPNGSTSSPRGKVQTSM